MANSGLEMPVTEAGDLEDTQGQGQQGGQDSAIFTNFDNFVNFFEDGNREFNMTETDWNKLNIPSDGNTEPSEPKGGQGGLDIVDPFEEFYDAGNQFSSPHDEDSILENLGNMKIETADIDEVCSICVLEPKLFIYFLGGKIQCSQRVCARQEWA